MFGLFKKNVAVVQTVNKIAAVVKPPAKEKDESSSDEEGGVDDAPEVAAKTVDVHVEPGGGKGWPTDVSTVFYHKQQALICVGTESGAVYVYGDGFQFMRPHTKDEGVHVKKIVALDPDLILVAFSDNSIDVLELPSMSLVGDLDKSWVGSKNGDITAIHVDEPSEKNYTYIGTSLGVLQVVDVSDSTVRVCDFSLTWKTMGLTSMMAISDIQMCPKDEKFLAVAFESAMVHVGAVVIFDLSRMKAHKVFETKAILSLAWNHTGDALYCGAKDGTLLTVGIDKTHAASPWHAKVELAQEEDEMDDVGEEPVCIKKLIWMAPQPPSVEGCLFALLGCPGNDNDSLKSVVVGLSPTGAHGDMEIVFSMPGISQEKVLEYSLVPTYLKSQAELVQQQCLEEDDDEDDPSAGAKNNALRATITPAIFVLTARYGEDEDSDATLKHLKIVRCPAVDMANWAFEVGTTPEPRLASEVLPGASNVTCICGFTAEKSVLSLATVLIKKGAESAGVITSGPRAVNTYSSGPAASPAAVAKSANAARRRLSTRDFFDLKQLDQEGEEDWEMVLAVGEHPDNIGQRKARVQDIVVKGYEDGTVVAWGVSLPESRGNIWLPLMSMRCGKTEVTCISHDERSGLLVAGDEQGVLVIWEIYEESSGMSASEVLRQVNMQATALANTRAKETAASRKAGGDSDEEEGSDGECNVDAEHGADFALFSMYNFNNVREVLRTRLHNHITATLLIPQFTSIVVGTEDGTVYICTQYSSVLFGEIENLDKFGASGSVIGLTFGSFLLSERYPVAAIYIAFANGNVVVVQLSTLLVVAHGPKIDSKHVSMLDETQRCSTNHELCLADGLHNRVIKPALKDMALVIAEDNLTNARNSPSLDAMQASVDDKSPLRDINAGLRAGLKQFATMKEHIDKTAKNTAQALKIPVPADKAVEPPQEPVRRRKKVPFREVPRYLLMLVGKLFLTYDLHRLTRTATKASMPGYNGSSLSIKVISQKQMICTRFLSYVSENGEGNDSDDGADSAMLCAASVNAHGLMVLVSAKQKALINHSQLVNETEDESQSLDFGCIMPNGNCYLVRQGGEMVHTTTISLVNSTLHLPYPLPDRASPGATAPKGGLMLLHGREGAIAAQRTAARKRRTSMLKLSSTPFELSKLFTKSRDQRAKDELTGASEEQPRGATARSSPAVNTANKATKATSGLSETREAFDQRGQKINRAAIKADEIKDTASQFNKVAKEQKEELKKKSNRWGLF